MQVKGMKGTQHHCATLEIKNQTSADRFVEIHSFVGSPDFWLIISKPQFRIRPDGSSSTEIEKYIQTYKYIITVCPFCHQKLKEIICPDCKGTGTIEKGFNLSQGVKSNPLANRKYYGFWDSWIFTHWINWIFYRIPNVTYYPCKRCLAIGTINPAEDDEFR